MMIDGGIRKPSVPAPASEPIARSRSYPRRINSVMVMRPTVAVVAAEDPETAANNVQPRTFTCSKRPGRRVVQGVRPENNDEDSLDRNKISAIRMNIGSAISSGVVETFHVSCPISRSIGMFRNTASATKPTMKRPKLIQTPMPSAASRTVTIVRIM